MKKKVIVGMSGGVDSSVVALLLKEKGYEVIGLTMYKKASKDNCYIGCYGADERNIEEAENVCKLLGIKHFIIDVSLYYLEIILKYFREEYLRGRTPNPCVMCNRYIKFGILWQLIKEKIDHFDYFATGHYARVEYRNNRWILKRGKDPVKDQSYFLCFLTQEQLAHTLFPLGEYTKVKVREIAFKKGLIRVATKRDSQDFSTKDSILPPNLPGPIKDVEGNVIGTHKGIWNYTIGQRRGLGIAKGIPLYVIKIEPSTNTIIVGERKFLYSLKMIVSNINWISVKRLTHSINATVKIRSMHSGAYARITPLGENKVEVHFFSPQRAITPGQFAVFYSNEEVIGGGVIETC